MKIKVAVHDAEEGGFWAEVPALPGCVSQGETMEELMDNLHEAIEGCLAVDVVDPHPDPRQRVPNVNLKEVLASGPPDDIDLTRPSDFGRDVEL